MLISTHVLTGALLGRAVGRPLPALALGVVGHLALDALPHWGQREGWPPGPPMSGDVLRVAVVDGLVGLGLIAVVARAASRASLPGVLAGVVGSCLPDLDKPGRLFVGRSPWPRAFDRVHAQLQVRSEAGHRLPGDVAVAAALAVVVPRLLRR